MSEANTRRVYGFLVAVAVAGSMVAVEAAYISTLNPCSTDSTILWLLYGCW